MAAAHALHVAVGALRPARAGEPGGGAAARGRCTCWTSWVGSTPGPAARWCSTWDTSSPPSSPRGCRWRPASTAFPFEAVIEVHVAGAVISRTAEGRGVYLDDHGQPLRSEVLGAPRRGAAALPGAASAGVRGRWTSAGGRPAHAVDAADDARAGGGARSGRGASAARARPRAARVRRGAGLGELRRRARPRIARGGRGGCAGRARAPPRGDRRGARCTLAAVTSAARAVACRAGAVPRLGRRSATRSPRAAARHRVVEWARDEVRAPAPGARAGPGLRHLGPRARARARWTERGVRRRTSGEALFAVRALRRHLAARALGEGALPEGALEGLAQMVRRAPTRPWRVHARWSHGRLEVGERVLDPPGAPGETSGSDMNRNLAIVLVLVIARLQRGRRGGVPPRQRGEGAVGQGDRRAPAPRGRAGAGGVDPQRPRRRTRTGTTSRATCAGTSSRSRRSRRSSAGTPPTTTT